MVSVSNNKKSAKNLTIVQNMQLKKEYHLKKQGKSLIF